MESIAKINLNQFMIFWLELLPWFSELCINDTYYMMWGVDGTRNIWNDIHCAYDLKNLSNFHNKELNDSHSPFSDFLSATYKAK